MNVFVGWVRTRWVMVALVCVGEVLSTSGVHADARTDYYLRTLRTSDSFRVRAQAALSLGRRQVSDPVVRGLVRALDDGNAAVRIAAATSLGRLGDDSALAALRSHRRDRDRGVATAVRTAIRQLEEADDDTGDGDSGSSDGPSRYYVGVGEPGAGEGAEHVASELLTGATSFLRGLVSDIDGVVLAPGGESTSQIRRALRRQRLAGYYIDSSVVRVVDRDGGVRVDVSLIVNTYPGRDMRAILTGSATVRGSSGARARRRAMEGAFTGAMRRLPQALAAADARSGG